MRFMLYTVCKTLRLSVFNKELFDYLIDRPYFLINCGRQTARHFVLLRNVLKAEEKHLGCSCNVTNERITYSLGDKSFLLDPILINLEAA